MAIIPLKQTVTIRKATGETDRFNRPVFGEAVKYRCRFTEGTKLVKARSAGMITSAEVVSSARIYLEGFVKINMDDEISYIDESESLTVYNPISYDVIRGVNGKAMLTVVYV